MSGSLPQHASTVPPLRDARLWHDAAAVLGRVANGAAVPTRAPHGAAAPRRAGNRPGSHPSAADAALPLADFVLRHGIDNGAGVHHGERSALRGHCGRTARNNTLLEYLSSIRY